MNASRSLSQSGNSLNCPISFELKQHVGHAVAALRRLIQQPVMPVVGVLIVAGAGKSGYGSWAAGITLASFSASFGVVATAMLTRSLGAWIARMQR